MLFKVFTIYDEKAKAYLPPFTLPTTPMAVRSFADCVNNPEHAFGRHPQDFTLFDLGSFDDAKALFEVHKGRAIHNGLEVVVSFLDDDQGVLPLKVVPDA